jgi:hypothetical protein
VSVFFEDFTCGFLTCAFFACGIGRAPAIVSKIEPCSFQQAPAL